MTVAKANTINDISVFSTGTFLDELTGLGGMPKGRMLEFWGEQNTGKSTAALQVIAAAQKLGDKALLIDTELSYTNDYAEKVGIDTSKLDILRGMTAEEILDEAEELIKAGKYGVVVMDSLGRLSSRLQFEKAAGEKTIGSQASLIKEFITKTIPYILLHKVCFIGISHLRRDLEWGKIYTLGGNRWHEARKLSIRFRESGKVAKRGEEVLGKEIIAKVTKNHLAGTEGKEMRVTLLNNVGFDADADLFNIALEKGLLTRTGNTIYFRGEKLGLVSKARDWAKENADTLREALKELT